MPGTGDCPLPRVPGAVEISRSASMFLKPFPEAVFHCFFELLFRHSPFFWVNIFLCFGILLLVVFCCLVFVAAHAPISSGPPAPSARAAGAQRCARGVKKKQS